uniref:WAP four-disulfide core domain protein 1 n=1 Tax=Sphaerodactylus townsendi TaxID=933632 RepID=A0ACB8EBF4_9SAUR
MTKQNCDKRERRHWFKFRGDYEYPLHSHGAPYQKNDRCPPPPQTLPDGACEVPGCRSDSECERHKRCCYNGCIYACLESVQPPPVLDWLVQPKPRWLGGNGWLLDGPEEALQAEACSTTEDGEETLRCPTGYECHIINPGNAAEGIPNRGQCIRQRGNSDGRNLQPKYYKEYLGKQLQPRGGFGLPRNNSRNTSVEIPTKASGGTLPLVGLGCENTE